MHISTYCRQRNSDLIHLAYLIKMTNIGVRQCFLVCSVAQIVVRRPTAVRDDPSSIPVTASLWRQR
jgi:hypothetical protein